MTRFQFERGKRVLEIFIASVVALFSIFSVPISLRFLRNAGIEKILLVSAYFSNVVAESVSCARARAWFVLTRENNFLGLIANYVTHCVSLNMILSKHSCFGLKQIGIMGSLARSLEPVLRISMENRIVIFLLYVY